jgi:large-conductance mechanosensitive channel
MVVAYLVTSFSLIFYYVVARTKEKKKEKKKKEKEKKETLTVSVAEKWKLTNLQPLFFYL